MTENSSQSRDGGRGDYSRDEPPMSRLFIICNKGYTEEDFRGAFSKFGEIEDIWVVKDKQTDENKGIAYIKYKKTSDAAKAQEEMNGKTMGTLDRTIIVLVAANRNQGSSKSENEHEKYVRLFIACPKTTTEEELREEFEQWGTVQHVTVVKDRATGIPKGCGYIRYSSFYNAAVAFENCPSKYKAVFAEPKGSTQSSKQGSGSGHNDSMKRGHGGPGHNNDVINNSLNNGLSQLLRMQNVQVPQPTSLEVIVSSSVTQNQLWHLFDIVPGLDNCQIGKEYDPRMNEAIVVYDNPESAKYAKDKLHGLEYPVGERLIVKISGMSSSHIDTKLIEKGTKKDSYCSVSLPPSQPLASSSSLVAQRLFIVLTSNLPNLILINVFSCWSGLIDAYLLPNKNCGYVRYTDRESALKAMEVLNGAEICGAKIKIMEAKEKDSGDGDDGSRKRLRTN